MHRRSLQLTALGVASFIAEACGYDNGPVEQTYLQPNEVVAANIDTDAKMTDLTPGKGVGMFVEYTSGGTWTVKFTCDTDLTSFTCPWSINALTLDGSSIGGVDAQLLDSEDAITRPRTDYLMFDGIATNEIDQFSFQATAGSAIGFDVWLQDEPNPNRFVFWVGDGALNKGVTSPSFDLYPTPAQ